VLYINVKYREYIMGSMGPIFRVFDVLNEYLKNIVKLFK